MRTAELIALVKYLTAAVRCVAIKCRTINELSLPRPLPFAITLSNVHWKQTDKRNHVKKSANCRKVDINVHIASLFSHLALGLSDILTNILGSV